MKRRAAVTFPESFQGVTDDDTKIILRMLVHIKHIKTYQNISKHIKTYQNISKHIENIPNISTTYQIYQIHIKNISNTHQISNTYQKISNTFQEQNISNISNI